MVANPIPHQRPYGRDELLADAIVHGGALVAALIAGGYMLVQSTGYGGAKIAALVVYVLSLVAMLGFSAAYNLTPASPVKWILRRFDHSAIYLMIAGTYTPVLLQLSDTGLALLLAGIVWGGAVAGILLKLFFPGRFDMLAVVIYLALGWVGMLAGKTLVQSLPALTMILIAAGGVIYSAGVPFYLWDRLKFQNAIWHGFVVTAATCHFIGIAALYL